MYRAEIMAQDIPGSGKPFTIPPPPEDTRTSLISNVLAVAGFIVVIIVVIWGLVHLASISRGWFGSFFGGSSQEETIEITAPENADSGEVFRITWAHEPSSTGSYAFLYQCVSGLEFRTPTPMGTLGAIPCGAAYTVPSENALTLTGLLSGTSSASVPLSIIFLPSATGTRAEGSASMTINRGAVIPTPTPTPTPQPTPTPTPVPTPRPATPADLSVYIVSVIPDAAGVTTVTFSIANNGGTSSGTYYFTAQLPTSQAYTYSSPAQASLAPGAHIVNTLRFTQTRQGGGTFSVSVDPSNTVRESNEVNNYASQFINTNIYNPYPQNYNYQYNQYQNPYNYSNQYPNQYQQYPYTQYYPYAY